MVQWSSIAAFFFCLCRCTVHLQHMWILWQHFQPAKALCLFLQTRSQLSIALNSLYFWWEMKKTKQKRHFCLFSVGCSVAGRTGGFLCSPIAGCQSALTSLHQWDWQIHTPTNTGTHAYARGTMQSLISQLQQIRTNVIVFDPKCAGALGKQWHFCLMLAVC